ncbi:transcriptional regulator, tetr family [hydrocarbon metagenome]|uniref:Transcriptional regulator, tetr family n=1 Tax=hydrocarbon metagenome TaxID=938273 RepID=A0A0W8E901_9ZZZZ
MRRKNEEKRENIKQAVIKLILDEGFHGASISKIAREAGVSPATVYIYYESKDEMLREIYQEYADQVYLYLLEQIDENMNGKQLIETIIKTYYSYIYEQDKVFYFVEQFSSCPSLVDKCRETEGCFQVFSLFDDFKEKNIIKKVDNVIIYSMLFYPVKCIATRYFNQEREAESALVELIELLQDTLLCSGPDSGCD